MYQTMCCLVDPRACNDPEPFRCSWVNTIGSRLCIPVEMCAWGSDRRIPQEGSVCSISFLIKCHRYFAARNLWLLMTRAGEATCALPVRYRAHGLDLERLLLA